MRKKENYLQKAKRILLEPNKFFKEVKKEKGLKKPIRFLLLLLLVTQVFVVLYYFKSAFVELGIELTMSSFIFVYIVTTIFMLMFSFVRSAITNFFVRFYSDKNSFEDTYKAMTYGLTPDYIGTPFFIVAMILLTINTFLKNPLIIVGIVVCGLVALAATIYSIYLRMLGISKIYEMSLWQSFLSIYLWPMILLIVIEMFIVGLYLIISFL